MFRLKSIEQFNVKSFYPLIHRISRVVLWWSITSFQTATFISIIYFTVKRMKKRMVLVFTFLLVVLSATLAISANNQPYHLKLLAVQEEAGNYTGSDADLYLELKEGSGRVFLETFPLTKMDTQISTRFAKSMACKHFKLNCNKYDFIYTIKAKSNIIGGPSAGAAIAALTTIAVLDLDYDKDVTITGTINSGGIIGPVGGIKEKLDAASQANLKKVMIAKGTAKQKQPSLDLIDENNQTENESSSTFDLVQYGKENLSLEVVEVIDLDEVVFHLTGETLNHREFNISESVEYKEIMKGLQQLLCDRTEQIESELKGIKLNENVGSEIQRKKGSAINATKEEDYYSAASFCFSNNIQLRTQYYKHRNLSRAAYANMFRTLEKKVFSLERKLDAQKIKTISDLQTLMVVKERASDVKEQFEKYDQNKDLLEELPGLLGYTEERFFSALSWMQFFSMPGKKLILDDERLAESCSQKISESEERYQYAELFLGGFIVSNIRGKINTAKNAQSDSEFELCLITAAQAKADANAILSSVGLSEDNFMEFVESKSKAAERVIFENSAEGMFPILGYSYYRYANNLKDQEKYTALVYLEYALEMSDLGIYFPEEQVFLEIEGEFEFDERWFYLVEGFLVGVLVTLVFILVGKVWSGKKFVKK